MSAKKLINSAEACAVEGLRGLRSSYPALRTLPEHGLVFDKVREQRRKAAVLSGGGSGHEPFSAGFVGRGMLAASVSGSVFASPPSGRILKALRKLSEENDGVFVVVPNYTGDVLNFGLAVEKARAEGLLVESIAIGEDIAQEALGITNRAGARGTCGLILALKIAGYHSEMGESVETVARHVRVVAENMATMGVGLDSSRLGPQEMELGVGVHGEAGVRKIPIGSAADTVSLLLRHLTKHLNLAAGDEVVVVVNDLGALSKIEMWIVAGEVAEQLSRRKVAVSRMYVGGLFTSLNAAGVQICLLRLPPAEKGAILTALDAPTSAAAWPGSTLSLPGGQDLVLGEVESGPATGNPVADPGDIVARCLRTAAKRLADNASHIDHLDAVYGDGDCGTTLGRFAEEIRRRMESLATSRPGELFRQLSTIADTVMGGTSGAIYGLFFVGASSAFAAEEEAPASEAATWSAAWSAGIDSIKKYSVARIGDRTLMDALEPSLEAFREGLTRGSAASAIASAAEAAWNGCSATKDMIAKVGRASYVGEQEEKCEDAGAFAVAVVMDAIRDEVLGEE